MERPDRVITEEVPGKQIVLCHIINRLEPELSEILDIEDSALAILTVTPSEIAYIAADCASKAAAVEVVFVDRYLGTVLINGTASAVRTALENAVDFLHKDVGLDMVYVTQS